MPVIELPAQMVTTFAQTLRRGLRTDLVRIDEWLYACGPEQKGAVVCLLDQHHNLPFKPQLTEELPRNARLPLLTELDHCCIRQVYVERGALVAEPYRASRPVSRASWERERTKRHEDE